jgi:cytochrome d ubiquinol oxidase subunit II
MANRLWPALLVVAVVFLGYSKLATKLYDNYLSNPLLIIVPLLAVMSLLGIRFCTGTSRPLQAFTASCLTIVLVVATGLVGLFPNLIPSSLDPVYSLTIFNSSSSPYTLKIMTVVAAIFVPVVISYKIWVYRIFRAPVTVAEVMEDRQSY